MLRGRAGSAKIAVLAIIEEELEASLKVFAVTQSIPGTPYYVREQSEFPGQYDIVVMRSGDRGNTPAGNATRDLIEDFRPEFILLVGIAGGYRDRDGTALGDVIVSDFITYSGFRKLYKGRSLPRYAPYEHPSFYLRHLIAEPLIRRDDWSGLIQTQRPAPGKPKVIIGNIVGGEVLLADPKSKEQQKILKQYDKALAFDMESWGVAQTVFQARKPIYYNPHYLIISL